MGLTTTIKEMYDKLLGGTNPPGAASNVGDIGQMIKYLVANPATLPDFPKYIEHSTLFKGTLPAATSWNISNANRVYFAPIFVYRPGTVVRLFGANGATVAGNVAMALYNGSGTRLAAPAAQAAAGVNSYQKFTVNVAITPGVYWVAWGGDNATHTYRASVPASGPSGGITNIFYADAAYSPPATLPAPTGRVDSYMQLGISFDANWPIGNPW